MRVLAALCCEYSGACWSEQEWGLVAVGLVAALVVIRLVGPQTGKEPATNRESSAGTAGGQQSGSGGTGVLLGRWLGGNHLPDTYFSAGGRE